MSNADEALRGAESGDTKALVGGAKAAHRVSRPGPFGLRLSSSGSGERGSLSLQVRAPPCVPRLWRGCDPPVCYPPCPPRHTPGSYSWFRNLNTDAYRIVVRTPPSALRAEPLVAEESGLDK